MENDWSISKSLIVGYCTSNLCKNYFQKFKRHALSACYGEKLTYCTQDMVSTRCHIYGQQNDTFAPECFRGPALPDRRAGGRGHERYIAPQPERYWGPGGRKCAR